jgi:hypothetical protein
MEKTCSKCAAPFTCQNEARGCWCEDLTLSAETLALLRQQYDNCLCPACLKSYEAEHKGAAPECIKKTP